MNTETTLEYRIFGRNLFSEEQRKNTVKKLLNTEALPEPDTRTDIYLKPGHPEDINGKWREGEFEVKKLRDTVDKTEAPDILHYYYKAGFDTESKPLSDDQWVEVEKDRYNIIYHFLSAGEICGIDLEENDGFQCAVELATVKVKNTSYQTICFEAGVTTDGAEVDNFLAAYKHFTDAIPALASLLSKGKNTGYVEWLYKIEL